MQNRSSKIRFSKQPFWGHIEAEKKIYLPNTQHPINFLILSKDGNNLRSVPGLGQMTIIFSCDQEHPDAWIYGIQEQYGEMSLHGMTSILMCRFFPGDFSRYFKCNAQDLTNISAPVVDVLGQSYAHILEMIVCESDFDKRCGIVTDTMLKRDSLYSTTRKISDYVTNEIYAAQGNVRMKELQQSTGYSERYLQKIIVENVGIAPKKLCMNTRFQFLLIELLKLNVNLSDVAQTFGFCDQSHFTKEFRRIMGESPNEFRRRISRFNL